MDHNSLINRLAHIVGPQGVVAEPSEQAPYVQDWLGKWKGLTPVVVRPRNTTEVSAVMRLCHQTHTPLVTQGGNTGMSGGATPDGSNSQIILSTLRMQNIRAVDPLNNTITVDAGVLLENIQKTAAKVQRLFPLSLGAQGSCTIGGNIATNAGGTAVVRYGNTRDLVLGLEVVLSDGRVWDGLRGLRKDNTGYDLKGVFIGSEGTLGVITGAVLKLFPAIQSRQTAWLGLHSIGDSVTLLRQFQGVFAEALTAFEMMTQPALDLVLKGVPNAKPPLSQIADINILVEISHASPETSSELFEQALARAIESGLVTDAVVAQSEQQVASLWGLREGISIAQVAGGKAIKHDIALPISALDPFVKEADEICHGTYPNFTVINFGHVGDGNLHYNVLAPMGVDDRLYQAATLELNRKIHDLVTQYKGSISAEHGVGQLRRDELKRYKSSVEYDLMMTIKRALDPNQLMNPGKLI